MDGNSLIPPTAYAVPEERSSPKVAAAWAEGCHGHATNENYLVDDRPVALFGSPARTDLVAAAKAEKRDLYYVDHGYWRNRKQFRIAKNRMQSYINPLTLPVYDSLSRVPHRFAALHLELVPEWHLAGNAILICPNSPTYMAWFGIDAKQWALDIATTVSKYTDRPIVIRWKSTSQVRPFYHDIHDAWATVVFSSGAAVESLSYGVPVFVLADWATTYPLGLADLSRIETPYYPPARVPFLHALAERQWSLAEIREGLAWKFFRSHAMEASI